MKITLSKSQWELIGQKTGWIKKSQWDLPEDAPHICANGNKLYTLYKEYVSDFVFRYSTQKSNESVAVVKATIENFRGGDDFKVTIFNPQADGAEEDISDKVDQDEIYNMLKKEIDEGGD